MISKEMFSSYHFQDNTPLEDETIRKFAQSVTKDLFGGMSTCPYDNYMGKLEIMISSRSKNDDPYYEIEILNNPDKVMMNDDLISLDPEDILVATFDVFEIRGHQSPPIIASGKITIALRYRTDSGQCDDGMMRRIYSEVSDRLKKTVMKDLRFMCFETNL